MLRLVLPLPGLLSSCLWLSLRILLEFFLLLTVRGNVRDASINYQAYQLKMTLL